MAAEERTNKVYLLGDGREPFLNFLRNLGSQAILLTALAVMFFSLNSIPPGSERLPIITMMLCTFVTLIFAVWANLLAFSSHAFEKERRNNTAKTKYFIDSLLVLFIMIASYFSILVATAAALTKFAA